MSLFNTDIPLNKLVFYRSMLEQPIIQNFLQLTCFSSKVNEPQALDAYILLKSDLIAYALEKIDLPSYDTSLWKDYIISQILNNENPLTLLFEKQLVRPEHPFYHTILEEFKILTALFQADWSSFLTQTDFDAQTPLTQNIFTANPSYEPVRSALEAKDAAAALTAVNHCIYHRGLGIFEAHASFKLDIDGNLQPITNQNYKPMHNLIGYELEKQQLIANTASFVKNYTGLNVLLQGDMGTGKSTMVKALLDTFKDSRLKMIEIKKDQLAFIPKIITTVKKRPYPFILFIDDLSFEEHDEDYKIFKNVLEGSLEENPKNLLIYATSNKRHLVTETRTERENAVHTKDVMEEKLSLSSRFGLVLNFTAPDQKSYLKIVYHLAAEAGIALPEETIRSEALKWEMRHLNRSGRTAEQFIHYLKVCQLHPKTH